MQPTKSNGYFSHIWWSHIIILFSRLDLNESWYPGLPQPTNSSYFFNSFYYCHMNNFYDGINVILQIILLLCFSNKIVVNFQFNITNISYTRLLFTICERDNHMYILFSVRTPSYWKVNFLNNFKFHSIYNLNCIVPKYLLIKKIWYHVKNKKC